MDNRIKELTKKVSENIEQQNEIITKLLNDKIELIGLIFDYIEDISNENVQLQIENKKLKEWQDANKPTGICETCTEISSEQAFSYEQALYKVKETLLTYCNDDCDNCVNGECSMKDMQEIINEVLKDGI